VTGHSTLRLEVWVDVRDRVRRLQLGLSVCSSAGTAEVTVSMDVYDFGRQPAVSAPAASQVTEVTSKLASQPSSSVAQLGCQQ
jgi:hypothetical protein